MKSLKFVTVALSALLTFSANFAEAQQNPYVTYFNSTEFKRLFDESKFDNIVIDTMKSVASRVYQNLIREYKNDLSIESEKKEKFLNDEKGIFSVLFCKGIIESIVNILSSADWTKVEEINVFLNNDTLCIYYNGGCFQNPNEFFRLVDLISNAIIPTIYYKKFMPEAKNEKAQL